MKIKMNKKKNDKVKEELIDEADKEELEIEAEEEIEATDAESSGEPREDAEDGRVEALENQLKRALADYQNLERRVADQKANWIMSANKDLILRLLPGLDNLLLADKHTQDEGVKIAIKHFMEILESDGVEKIKTENADFDPNLMEAISTTEGDEGKVVEEVKTGYTLNGDVIRAAQVVVGSAGQNN